MKRLKGLWLQLTRGDYDEKQYKPFPKLPIPADTVRDQRGVVLPNQKYQCWACGSHMGFSPLILDGSKRAFCSNECSHKFNHIPIDHPGREYLKEGCSEPFFETGNYEDEFTWEEIYEIKRQFDAGVSLEDCLKPYSERHVFCYWLDFSPMGSKDELEVSGFAFNHHMLQYSEDAKDVVKYQGRFLIGEMRVLLGDVIGDDTYVRHLGKMLEHITSYEQALITNESDFVWGEPGLFGTHNFLMKDGKVGFLGMEKGRRLRFFEGLAIVRKDDKFGYVNEGGEVVIDFDFIDAKNFSKVKAPDGKNVIRAIVGLKTETSVTYRVIDEHGQIISDLRVNEQSEYFEGLIAFNEGDCVGFMDADGKVVIQPKYEVVKRFSEGVVWVKHKRGDKDILLINRQGEELFSIDYGVPTGFGCGLAVVKRYDNDLCGVIDIKGNVVLSFKYRNVDIIADQKYFLVELDDETFACVDPDGNFVISPEEKQSKIVHQMLRLPGVDSDQVFLADWTREGHWITTTYRETWAGIV